MQERILKNIFFFLILLFSEQILNFLSLPVSKKNRFLEETKNKLKIFLEAVAWETSQRKRFILGAIINIYGLCLGAVVHCIRHP